MKKNNTHFEHSHMKKHLDDSISNVGGDEDYNVDGDDSNIDGDDFSNARGGGGGGRGGFGGRGGGGFRSGGFRSGGFRSGGFRSGSFRSGGGFRRGGVGFRHGGGGRGWGRRGGYYGNLWGWGWGYYPFLVYPAYDYYYDVLNPRHIKITPKGLKYLSLNPTTNIYTYYLNAIKDGSLFDETDLYGRLNLGQDYNEVVGWLYGNKLIEFVN